MTTPIRDDSPVRRQTAITYRRHALIISLHPRRLEIHEKQRRDSLSISYDALYEFLIKRRWQQEQAEKRRKRSVAK